MGTFSYADVSSPTGVLVDSTHSTVSCKADSTTVFWWVASSFATLISASVFTSSATSTF